MKKLLGIFTIVIAMGVVFVQQCQAPGGSTLQVTEIRTEYLKNPDGIDMQYPRFSWIIESTLRGITQSAYQILVSGSRELAEQKQGNIWDSGKVESERSTNVAYQGPSLESDRTYYVKVRIWDQDSNASSWSATANFHTGLMENQDWQGEWIGVSDSSLSSPLLRKEFQTEKEIEEAYIFVSGLGYYELYLNGQKVGDHVLDPAETEYGTRVKYSTFEVSDMLQSGENVVGLMLGNGQFHITRIEGRYNKGAQRYPSPYGLPRAILQLNIRYADGSDAGIVTDGSWKASAGPIVFNNFYSGEDYDARLEQPGWKSAGFDDSEWASVQIMESSGELDAQLIPPMKVMDTIQPIRRTNPEPGVYLFDLGQNIIGYPRISAQAPEGTTIRIRCAETLNNNRFPKILDEGDSLSTMHDYHRDAWMDYTFKGEGTETYEPRFFFTGYRYVEVRTDPRTAIEDLSVVGRLVHTAVEYTGSFSSSNALINNIHNNAVWAQRGNMSSIPTDCPQREKWGWTADAHLYTEEANHNFFMPVFWTKWLDDLNDSQEIAGAGAVPDVVPNYTEWRGHAAEQWGGSGTPAWGSAYPIVYWYTYSYYSDQQVLEDHYEGIKAWTDYLTSTAENHIIPWGRGDWGAPGPTADSRWERISPVPLTSTAYYYACADIAARAAEILGKADDAAEYTRLRSDIMDRFNQEFFSRSTNQYMEGSQTSNAVPLDFGVVPEDRVGEVLDNIVADIEEIHDTHFFTGILGTKALINILPDHGLGDLLFEMITQTTYPGYGFWIENGATTLWEFWSGHSSHNHAMFGSVDEFFYNNLAGITAPTQNGTTPGYKHILIEPLVLNELEKVSANVKTIRGNVTSGWTKSDTALNLNVSIPVNATATLRIPTLEFNDVTLLEGDQVVWQQGKDSDAIRGINNVEMDEAYISVEVGSGVYAFRIRNG